MELIAVSIPQNHPSGARRRCGFEFTSTPRIAEVTPEQRSEIKNDKYLTIHRRLSQAWFKAMGLEFTEKNEKKFKDEDPKNWMETANVAPSIITVQEAQEKKEEKAPYMKKDDIIKALKEQGLVEGKDFDPNAKRDALLPLLPPSNG